MIVSSAWQKITTNTLYQLFGRGYGILVGFFAIALITRTLGTEGYGDYVLITTVPALFYLIADFGLNAIFLREIAKGGEHVKKFGGLLALRLVLAVLLSLVGLVYVFVSPYNLVVKWGIVFSLLAIFAQATFTSLNVLFQHNLRYNLSVLAAVLSDTTELVLVSVGFLLSLGLLFFVGAWAFVSFPLIFFGFLFSKKLREGPVLFWDFPWMKKLFLSALPIGLTLVFAQVNGTADIFLLSLLDRASALGIYGLGSKIFESVLYLPLFFVNALYPVFLTDHRRSLAALADRLGKSLLVMLAASLVLVFLVFIFAPLAIFLLGGASFSSSTIVLRILSLSFPLFFITVPLQWFLITVGYEKVLPVIYGAAAVVNVVINVVFIPQFSYFAAVAATISSEFLILILLAAFTGKVLVTARRS